MRPIHIGLCLMAMACSEIALSQEAYVYDTVAAGTYVYDASSTGKLSLVKGSPFQTVGQIIGTNGKFFFTQGSGYIFAYAIESNGGIGKQAAKINTQIYSGADCSSAPTAELDHTGSYIYVLLDGGYSGDGGTCAAVQTYEISSKGALTFKGSTDAGVGTELPKLTGNNKFGYSVEFAGDYYDDNSVQGFTRETGGSLNQNLYVDPATPLPQSGYSYVWAGPITPDPTDHLAAVVNECSSDYGCSDETLPDQLASFTVGSQGEVTSTNNYADMPTFSYSDSISSIMLDPTGKILAVAIDTGVQFFHFNGANPITPFTGIIGVSGYVTGMTWDSDGHLYAQNGASGRMHVYGVTTESAKELSGSPTVIPMGTLNGNPVSSFVVRKK